MSLSREQSIFLQHVAELVRKAPDYGLTVTAGELYRTPEQQALYVKNGRSKTLNSQHLKRLAIDLNFFKVGNDGSMELVHDGDDVRHLGAFWESLDPARNRWGGHWTSFKDMPHFERKEAPGESPAPAASASPNASSTAGTSAPEKPVRGSALLTGSVGYRCQNQSGDVESVQRLLNLNASRLGLEAPLKCDGIIGEKTIGALLAFQKAVFASAEPSCAVNPRDPTLCALCAPLPKALDPTLLSLAYLNAAEEAVSQLCSPLVETMTRYDISTPLRQAHFLAQVGHESGELRFRQELANGSAYENRRDLGNTQPGDGPRYKGRGLIQLTGRANYAEYTRSREVDLVAHPEQVATDDRLCVDVAGWFWDRHHLNALADRDDVETITRRINGGLNGLPDRRRLLGRAKTLLGA